MFVSVRFCFYSKLNHFGLKCCFTQVSGKWAIVALLIVINFFWQAQEADYFYRFENVILMSDIYVHHGPLVVR